VRRVCSPHHFCTGLRFAHPLRTGNNIFQPGKEGSGEKGSGSGSGDRPETDADANANAKAKESGSAAQT